MKVETTQQWEEIEPKLREREYQMYQSQYDTNQEEGWHVMFISIGTGLPQIEVVTHSSDVRAAIFKYNHEYNVRHSTNP